MPLSPPPPSTHLPRSLATLLLPALVAVLPAAAGCAADVEPPTDTGTESFTARRPPPLLPDASSAEPWGGADAGRWRPEAIVANAASAALNDEARATDGREVVVAIPVRFATSDLFPYGDGQSNAAPTFRGAPGGSRPPVVATLVRGTSAPPRVTIRFDRALPTDATAIDLAVPSPGGGVTWIALEGTRTASGDLEAAWEPAETLGLGGRLTTLAFSARPRGWGDAFPSTFRQAGRDARALRAGAQVFADVRRLLDRERIASPGDAPGGALERLLSHAFAAPYNGGFTGHVEPYVTSDVHGRLPQQHAQLVTAVGGGRTWVASERPGGYKVMYQCLEARDPRAEREAPHGGVASGSGWHKIGDRAETFVNDLEGAPFLVGAGTERPLGDGLGAGGFAWGLTDVVTVRWLAHGEAMVTPRGGLHWLVATGARPSCGEIVVSPEGADLAGGEP